VKRIPVSRLVPGVILELTGRQKLWDTTKTPWRQYSPPARFRVLQITRMPTGASGELIPYTVTLLAADGTRIDLEVADGKENVAIVELP